MKHHVSYRLR